MSIIQNNKNFILVTTDGETETGKRASANSIALKRLEKGVWPLYSRTKHKTMIGVGHNCFFYLAGQKTNRQCIIGSATVQNIRNYNQNLDKIDLDFIGDRPEKILILSNIQMFSTPLYIKPLVENLDIFKNIKRWGVALMGGCRLINDNDYKTILNAV